MITAFDDNPEPILDPTYGELVIRYEKWGTKPNGIVYDEVEVLETHVCTDEELGLIDGEKQLRFFPIRPSIKG